MHQLTGIALCAFLFVFTVTGEDSDDEDLPSVTMEVLSSGDNMTSDDISVGHMNKSSSSNLSESYTTHKSDTGLENSTESRIFAESNADGDLDWLNDAIRDVTYYLRAYKFNEYDRRYQKEAPESPGQFFKSYPKPPLRSLHWEVQKHCELSFLSCLKYLSKRIKLTILHREDDTSEVINKQKWYNSTYKKQIDGVDADCQVMKEKDEKFFRPFQGPIERFQWRTTASYYLCWYTMNEVPNLKKLGERCDNFANCLDPQYGANNKDVRASDDKPYQCMLYSVCPDPCCPLRHITNYDECWNNEVNPCFQDNPIGNRQCLFERNRNTDFRDIVLNRWNVTCACSQSGYIWESRFGTCVDINECAIGNHNCDESSEVCVNLPGSYRCLCNWGYLWINKLNRCETSLALDLIKSHQQPICNFNRTKTFSGSLIKYIKSKLFSNSNRNDSQQYKNCGMSFYILATLIAGITFKFLFNLEKY